ncbi:hypothetical protein BCR35DRAFT_301629 [Leucosporidium creatinivorum]|uniref:Uncharacterized protein n=1 Tax=Leucosporidium creatinivorum TaxID=106004 RepID=A0A1Y2FWX5_9BASI|nr:hypothetical protein BCR35DRAFT_301629 [Leucosporidium creatinivorum]
MVRRVTGLQRQVYSLYKRSLKMIASKPLETRPGWFAFVSHQFRHPTLGGGLRRKDVGAIEYYLRRGEKMLEQFQSTGAKSVSIPEGSEEWKQGWVAKGGKERLRS